MNAKACRLSYYKSPVWRTKTAAVRELQGYKCAWCREPGYLETHHLTYERFGKEFLADLEALCPECHAIAHGLKGGHALVDEIRFALDDRQLALPLPEPPALEAANDGLYEAEEAA